MAQLLNLANAIIAVLPAGALFFWAYGRYDGTFRDNVVFLFFVGGMLMGGLLGFLWLLSLELVGALVGVILMALLLPISVVVGINRRKWQGERHAVFNGGAFGLGVAVMIAFSFLFRVFKVFSWWGLAEAAAFAAGAAGIFFGLGLLGGNGVRMRTPIRYALIGSAIALTPIIFTAVWYQSRLWTFPVLLAAYGAVFAFVAEKKLLIEGVPEDARKQRRRLRRRTA